MLAAPIGERVRTANALLPLKYSAPPLRAGVLLRQDLQGLLSDVRLNPVTVITAPAGFGKTTLLLQWHQELSRTGALTCWLSLDSGDRDTAIFLAYLISTFQSAFPGIGADAWRVLHSAKNLDRDWPLVAGSLCSDLQRRMLSATFLILDDLHVVLESAVITQILGYLLRAAPPTLHIVLSSRRTPVFAPLSRLRAEGRMVEVGQPQLHLTTREVEQILATQGVTLNQTAMEHLLDRTEGWALSVQLAARALAAQPPHRREEFVRALGGTQEQLLQYLSSEVLADLPSDIIDFLRLAAIPTSFDADLLAEVLQSEDVDYLLQRAKALGLPLLPLDDQGQRMRFHPLWRELLLRSTLAELDEVGLRVLQRRFGQVFEARGDLESALEHFAAARDTADLLRALRERAWPLLRTPRRDMVRRWIEQLPPGLRENEPDLLHMFGMSLLVADTERALQVLRQAVDRFREGGMYEREMRAIGDLAALLMWLAPNADHSWIGRRVCVLARHLGDDWSMGAARVSVAGMLFTQGREKAALRVARQAANFPLNPSWHWMLAVLISSIGVRLGQPVEVIKTVDGALGISAIDLDDRLRQSLLRFRGIALFQQGQLPDAVATSMEAHRHLGDYGQNGILAQSASQLGLILAIVGRSDEAATYLLQARNLSNTSGDSAALATLSVIDAYNALRRSQLPSESELNSTLRRLQDTTGRGPDLHLWLLLAVTYGESGYEARALSLARETVRQMREHSYRLFLACALLYLSQLAANAGEKAEAELALREGWELTAVGDHRYLAMLPPLVVREVARRGLTIGIDSAAIGRVLQRQIPELAPDLLQTLLTEADSALRARAARLLGDFGALGSYNALRGLLKDRDVQVRHAAEDALGRLVYRPSYTLRVRTLGVFGVWRGDIEIKDRDWRSSKARQLFQILLTERGKHLARDWILETLWPEMDGEAAANNLRVTLNRLSKAIEPDRPDGAPSSYILQQAETYSFNMSSNYELDLTLFAAAVEAGREAEQNGQRRAAIAAYRQAMELYGGSFLPDNLYEDWTVVERERQMLAFNDAALRLGGLLLDEGQAHDAIGLGWRVLENDHAQEDAYRLLMRAHLALGERSIALRLYNRCVTALQQELGVEPLDTTVALYRAIRDSGQQEALSVEF